MMKILIVDDEMLVIKSLERLLKKSGYDVQIAQNADDAIDAVKKSDYDLIISDIRMPGKDGVTMIREIRSILASQNRKKIPEIFMTGYASDDTAKQAENLRVTEYIYKPFDVKRFLELVQNHIGK